MMKYLPHQENTDRFVHEFGVLLVDSQVHTANDHAMSGMMAFAEYLHTARTMIPCSQLEFAVHLGISEAQLAAMEHGLLPRSAISSELLRNIASLVGEEEEILLLILDSNNAGNGPRSFVGAARSLSNTNHRRRFRFIAYLAQYFVKQERVRIHYFFGCMLSLLTWLASISSRFNRRLERLLSRKPVNDYFIVRLPRMGTVALSMLLAYWLVVGIVNPAQEMVESSDHPGELPSLLSMPVADSYHSIVTPIQSGQMPHRAIYPSYQIVYLTSTAAQDVATKAYIEVNDHEFAAIQFLTMTDLRPCVSDGRVDLCPI